MYVQFNRPILSYLPDLQALYHCICIWRLFYFFTFGFGFVLCFGLSFILKEELIIEQFTFLYESETSIRLKTGIYFTFVYFLSLSSISFLMVTLHVQFLKHSIDWPYKWIPFQYESLFFGHCIFVATLSLSVLNFLLQDDPEDTLMLINIILLVFLSLRNSFIQTATSLLCSQIFISLLPVFRITLWVLQWLAFFISILLLFKTEQISGIVVISCYTLFSFLPMILWLSYSKIDRGPVDVDFTYGVETISGSYKSMFEKTLRTRQSNILFLTSNEMSHWVLSLNNYNIPKFERYKTHNSPSEVSVSCSLYHLSEDWFPYPYLLYIFMVIFLFPLALYEYFYDDYPERLRDIAPCQAFNDYYEENFSFSIYHNANPSNKRRRAIYFSPIGRDFTSRLRDEFREYKALAVTSDVWEETYQERYIQFDTILKLDIFSNEKDILNEFNNLPDNKYFIIIFGSIHYCLKMRFELDKIRCINFETTEVINSDITNILEMPKAKFTSFSREYNE